MHCTDWLTDGAEHCSWNIIITIIIIHSYTHHATELLNCRIQRTKCVQWHIRHITPVPEHSSPSFWLSVNEYLNTYVFLWPAFEVAAKCNTITLCSRVCPESGRVPWLVKPRVTLTQESCVWVSILRLTSGDKVSYPPVLMLTWLSTIMNCKLIPASFWLAMAWIVLDWWGRLGWWFSMLSQLADCLKCVGHGHAWPSSWTGKRY